MCMECQQSYFCFTELDDFIIVNTNCQVSLFKLHLLDSQGCTCHGVEPDETCLDCLRSKANIGRLEMMLLRVRLCVLMYRFTNSWYCFLH